MAATGTSIIAAVTDALRHHRDDLDAARANSDAEGRARYDRIMAMTGGNRPRWDKDMLTIDHGDLL